MKARNSVSSANRRWCSIWPSNWRVRVTSKAIHRWISIASLRLTEGGPLHPLKSRLNDFTGFNSLVFRIRSCEGEPIDQRHLDLDPEDRAATADLAKREQDLADFLRD